MSEETTIREDNRRTAGMPIRVQFVSGQPFFCRRLELPSELEKEEEQTFIELEIEQLSPFPIEHLYYGYRIDEARRFVFVFASYKRRFELADTGKWSGLDAVYPEFVQALFEDQASGSPLAIVGEHSISFSRFDGLSSLPVSIESFERKSFGKEEETEPVSLEEEFYATAEKSRADFDVADCRVYTIDTNVVEMKGDLVFAATEGGNDLVKTVKRSSAWSLDVRDEGLVSLSQLENRRNQIIWKVVLGCAALIALLLVSEVFYGVSSGYLNLRKGWNSEQESGVEYIISNNNTVDRLATFEESALDPFALLFEILDNGLKTDDMQFTKMDTDGPNILQIDANTTSQNLMNQFRARLENHPTIHSAVIEKPRTANRRTEFSIKVNFAPEFLELKKRGGVAFNE